MEELRITIVGQDIFREVIDVFADVDLNEEVLVNRVKEIRDGMLGNLKTLTYVFLIPSDTVIRVRKAIMVNLTKNSTRLLPMYVHGDWMRMFVFKNFRT